VTALATVGRRYPRHLLGDRRRRSGPHRPLCVRQRCQIACGSMPGRRARAAGPGVPCALVLPCGRTRCVLLRPPQEDPVQTPRFRARQQMHPLCEHGPIGRTLCQAKPLPTSLTGNGLGRVTRRRTTARRVTRPSTTSIRPPSNASRSHRQRIEAATSSISSPCAPALSPYPPTTP